MITLPDLMVFLKVPGNFTALFPEFRINQQEEANLGHLLKAVCDDLVLEVMQADAVVSIM